MKKAIRTVLNLLLALVFLFGIVRFAGQQRDKITGSRTYADALALASSGEARPEAPSVPTEGDAVWAAEPADPGDPHVQTLETLDLEALREVNPDVIGWILIPDTEVNYPLLQGSDNDYYLNHTWDGRKNTVGSIYLEQLNSPDFTDFNTIVYGHNMKDGSMFASVRNYQQQRYWEAHPYVYIRTDLGVYRYEIFSSYLADVDSNTYAMHYTREDSRNTYIGNVLESSAIQTGIRPEATDRMLTLSTCSGKGHTTRWVVHARLKMIRI